MKWLTVVNHKTDHFVAPLFLLYTFMALFHAY